MNIGERSWGSCTMPYANGRVYIKYCLRVLNDFVGLRIRAASLRTIRVSTENGWQR